MKIIPVIDVKDGVAVRAIAGDRANYRPLASPLATSAEPLSVASGLLKLHNFSDLYLADLDGIECKGSNVDLLDRIHNSFPSLLIWLDSGVADIDAARRILAHPNVILVLGSESQIDASLVADLTASNGRSVALSLDFRGDEFQGPPDLLASARHWPARVIVMTLARVGAGTGPDLARIAAFRRAAGARSVYAAGGVRNRADLEAARQAGAEGALIATALHNGDIGARDLASLEACEQG